MTHPLRLTAIVAAALILLTGCTGELRGASPAPQRPSPTATPTPTLEPVVDEPEPRFDLSCDDIAAMVDFTVFPEPISLHDPYVLDVSRGEYMHGPDWDTAFRTYGGLTCPWWGKLPEYIPMAQDRQFPDAMLEVTVLPEAREFAASKQYPPRDSSLSDCADDPNSGYQNLCMYSKLVGDYWIDIIITGAEATDSIVLISDIEARVAALGPAGAAWIPSPPPPPLPGSCDTVLDDSSVIAEYFGGVPLEPWFGSAIGHFGMELTNAQLGAWTCDYARSNEAVSSGADEVGRISVDVLPRAGWAVTAYTYAGGRGYSVTDIAVPGLRPSEISSTCGEKWSSCLINMNVDGNWIAVSVDEGPNPAQTATEVATAVVARLRSGNPGA